MIVDEPPYELVALFADEDARRLIMQIVERGQEFGCLRRFRWRAVRDPRKDQIGRAAAHVLGPYLSEGNCRFVVLWDHHGSGREGDATSDVEGGVVQSLVRAGISTANVAAVAFVPELEVALIPAWERTLQLIAERRKRPPPTSDEILGHLRIEAGSIEQLLRLQPKELFDAALRLLQLRHSAELFEDLGNRLSIPALKGGDALGRLLAALVSWFPPDPIDTTKTQGC
jgi:hypothetical protein